MCGTHAISVFSDGLNISLLRPSETFVLLKIFHSRMGQPDLPPAVQCRKPILPMRFRKPTRPLN